MNRDIMNVIFGGMSVAPPKKVWCFSGLKQSGGSMARFLWEMLERIRMKLLSVDGEVKSSVHQLIICGLNLPLFYKEVIHSRWLV